MSCWSDIATPRKLLGETTKLLWGTVWCNSYHAASMHGQQVKSKSSSHGSRPQTLSFEVCQPGIQHTHLLHARHWETHLGNQMDGNWFHQNSKNSRSVKLKARNNYLHVSIWSCHSWCSSVKILDWKTSPWHLLANAKSRRTEGVFVELKNRWVLSAFYICDRL